MWLVDLYVVGLNVGQICVNNQILNFLYQSSIPFMGHKVFKGKSKYYVLLKK